jgi:hypothetical protein
MAGPVRVDPKSGGLKMWTDGDVANKLNGLALVADVLEGEKREGAVVMMKAVCASFGLKVELEEKA